MFNRAVIALNGNTFVLYRHFVTASFHHLTSLFLYCRDTLISGGFHYLKSFEDKNMNSLCRHSDDTDSCGMVSPDI